MAAFTITGSYFPKGTPDQSHFYVILTTTQLMANTDTLDITLPQGVDVDCLPLSMVAFAPVSSNVRATNTLIAVTNHNTATGVTRLTATGAVAVGTTIMLSYLGT